MKKRIITAVGCLLMGAATALASNELVIHLSTGTVQRFVLLQEEPTISFQGNDIVVTTTTAEVTYAMEDVSFFNYENVTATGIGEVNTGNGMSVDGDHIAFNGLPAGSKVVVYGTGGQAFITVTADNDGHAELSLEALARGVYIVKANNLSTKITKK